AVVATGRRSGSPRCPSTTLFRSEAAAAALFPGATLQPRRTFAEVFAALEAHDVDAAVVPVENTHAGSVADVYDLLRQHTGAKVIDRKSTRLNSSHVSISSAVSCM